MNRKIHIDINLTTRTIFQVIASSKRRATIPFDGAAQGEIFKEIKKESIGKSSSEVKVILINKPLT